MEMVEGALVLEIARYTAKYKNNFWKFCIVGLSGAVIQIGLTRLLFFIGTSYFNISGGNANTIAVIIVIPITTVWNFIWNALWAFKR